MKSDIPAPAIIAAVVVILLVLGFFGWRALNTEPTRTGVGANGAKINSVQTPGQPMTPAVPGNSTAPAGQPMSAPAN